MPFEADLYMASINLSLSTVFGKYQFHSPISSFASNCKNRQQIQLLFANLNMNNKHMYDNKNNIA
jgi:hypothetical protein